MQWAGLLLLIAGLIALIMSAKDASDVRRLNRGDDTVTPIGGQTRCLLNIMFAGAFVAAGAIMMYNAPVLSMDAGETE